MGILVEFNQILMDPLMIFLTQNLNNGGSRLVF
jgi:hypothetical protein